MVEPPGGIQAARVTQHFAFGNESVAETRKGEKTRKAEKNGEERGMGMEATVRIYGVLGCEFGKYIVYVKVSRGVSEKI